MNKRTVLYYGNDDVGRTAIANQQQQWRNEQLTVDNDGYSVNHSLSLSLYSVSCHFVKTKTTINNCEPRNFIVNHSTLMRENVELLHCAMQHVHRLVLREQETNEIRNENLNSKF